MATSASKSKDIVCQNQVENMLAQHVAFFDRNHDGIIYPWETYQGFRAIGCSAFTSLAVGVGINVALSFITRPGKFPSPLFPIVVQNIPKAKHGSDTGVYDAEGRFVQEKFDEIFSRHAHLNKNGLNILEVQLMLMANRKKDDLIGSIVAFAEWNFLYYLANNKGLLEKNTIRGMYDGTLFQQMEADQKSANKRKEDK
ncbi:putative peroxygenase 4 [Silene latifolia]|uniref:putative peroxygenase 4 n=1 Tax=Silene latifolia TaxID=37657 RepID=UPI003D76C5E0